MSTRSWIFHPIAVLIISLAGGCMYGAWATWQFSGDTLASQYLYEVPIVVPCVAFILDRFEQWRPTSIMLLAVDVLVVATSILRARGYVPLVSGHALFLTYAMLRRGSMVTRLAAALVMLEAIYLKFLVGHDFVTPAGGIALAVLAALIVRRLEGRGSLKPKSAPAVL
jgi:hypothetical protein